jgi:hypothetical protein
MEKELVKEPDTKDDALLEEEVYPNRVGEITMVKFCHQVQVGEIGCRQVVYL